MRSCSRVKRANSAVSADSCLVKHHLAAAIRLAEHVCQCMRGLCGLLLGRGIGRRAPGTKPFEPGHQLGAHAGARWLRLVRKAGDQQCCHVLTANADWARTFPFDAHVLVDVIEIRAHVIWARAGALHQARQGILVDPAQFRDSARIGACLGHRLGIQLLRNLLGIVGTRHWLTNG